MDSLWRAGVASASLFRPVELGASRALAPGFSSAAISARSFWRSTSMETGLPSASKYQNVQPLHADRPCSSAATRWIEPEKSVATRLPSARTARGIAPALIEQDLARL